MTIHKVQRVRGFANGLVSEPFFCPCSRFVQLLLSKQEQDYDYEQDGCRVQIPLRVDAANILFVGSPDCVLPDASGKFFAHF
jgi:hypothetical protein